MRSNTARFAPYMGGRSKQVIRLCNLARRDPELLKRYVAHRYGEEAADRRGIRNLKARTKKKKSVPLLRPSLLLTPPSTFHAFTSGITAYTGHRGMMARAIIFGNFNSLWPGIETGENCVYGSFRAFDMFVNWMESSGHKANILNPNFYRIGMGGFPHFGYRYNMVQMFTGPKIIDLIIRPGMVFRKK